MDAAAREMAARWHPWVPPALLAHLWRTGQPFPPQPDTPATTGFGHVLAVHDDAAGELLPGGDYIRFSCTRCGVLVFTPNTDRGIAWILPVAKAHHGDKPGCCDVRSGGGVTAWPDRLHE